MACSPSTSELSYQTAARQDDSEYGRDGSSRQQFTIPRETKTQGRVTVVFRGNWAPATDIARTNLPGIELVEIAVVYQLIHYKAGREPAML